MLLLVIELLSSHMACQNVACHVRRFKDFVTIARAFLCSMNLCIVHYVISNYDGFSSILVW